jgi:hypothetical protein
VTEPIKAACGATRNVWGLPLQDDFVSRCDREIHSTFMHCPPEALCATDKADCLHHVPPAEQPESVSHSGDCAIWERTVPPLACDCREPVRVVVLSLDSAEKLLARCRRGTVAATFDAEAVSELVAAIEAAKGTAS